jgi:hypothetical protein
MVQSGVIVFVNGVTERKDNKMKTKIVKQECNECGRQFNVEYSSNGGYNYIENTCDCESDFSPVDGPSISEWMEETASK